MRKLYLTAIIVVIILSLAAVIAFYYLSMPTTFPNILNEPKNQGNGSQGGAGPFNSPSTNQTNEQSNETGGAGGGGANAGARGTSGGPSEYTPKNYASVDSIPEGLKIFAGYYINGTEYSMESDAPFNLDSDTNSYVCILPASVISNGTFKWTVDGQNCPFSVCEGFYYNGTVPLYIDYGCIINMNENHSVILSYTPS